MKITKEFKWEMGHRLINHPGKCRNVHGHSYQLWVDIEGEPDENGMIIDFYDVSQIVKPLVEELDHAFMCHDQDSEILAYLQRNEMKLVVVPFPSTVENMCIYFAEKIKPAFKDYSNVTEFAVRIHETSSSEASLTDKL